MRSMLKLIIVPAIVLLALGACYPNPAPPGLTPIPSLAPAAVLTPIGTVEAQPTVPPTAQMTVAAGTAGTAAPETASAGTAAPVTTAVGTAAAGGAAPAGNQQQGATLFATSCMPCHGQGGQGGGVGPKLVGDKFVQAGPDQNIYNTIANGRPGTAMPAWSKAKGGALSDQEIYDLIAYLKSLQK
jgi:mono/diheme cytochrome c family protein